MCSTLRKSREIAFRLQGGRCHYCGVRMDAADSKGPLALRCTAEHLIPRSDGGADRASNIVAACGHCNRTRHKRKVPPSPDVYRKQVQRRVRLGRWHLPWVFQRGLIQAGAVEGT